MKMITAGGFNAGLTRRALQIFVVMMLVTIFLSSPPLVAEAFCVVRSTRSTSTSTTTAKSAQQHQHGLLFSSSELSKGQATTTRTSLFAASEGSSSSSDEDSKPKSLKFLLDPGTKGGAVFLSIILFLVPIVFYNVILVTVPDVDPLDAGKWIGAGFTILATLAWVSTYIFRVATKDMTYAKQLKDYENAVIAKRLEELDEDELQALVEEVERDDF